MKIAPRRRAIAFIGVLAIMAQFLMTLPGCSSGEAQSTTAAPSPVTLRDAVHAKLYAHSTAQTRIWSSTEPLPAALRNVADRAGYLLGAIKPVEWQIWATSYKYTNLPQASILLHTPGNKKLLVYNHGHSGLPGEADVYVFEFLKKAHASGGYDVLVTSMPLVGLNTPAFNQRYWAVTRSSPTQAEIHSSVLSDFSSMHALYEVIGDPDHYLHYFLDSGVMVADALAAAGASGYSKIENKALIRALYDKIDYVGLSGGATTGLIGCVIYKFDHCILIAGVMPDHLRLPFFGNFGDAEQHTRSFYEEFPLVSLMREATLVSRKLVLMFNSSDNCCFGNPAASMFREQYPEFDIRVRQLNFHGYEPRAVILALDE